MTYRHAIAGALVLNIPMLVAAAYLPAAATATMAVCLAALGVALGTLAGWGIEPQRAARGTGRRDAGRASVLRRGRVERPGSGAGAAALTPAQKSTASGSGTGDVRPRWPNRMPVTPLWCARSPGGAAAARPADPARKHLGAGTGGRHGQAQAPAAVLAQKQRRGLPLVGGQAVRRHQGDRLRREHGPAGAGTAGQQHRDERPVVIDGGHQPAAGVRERGGTAPPAVGGVVQHPQPVRSRGPAGRRW